MLSQSLILLVLSGAAFAIPQPQNVAGGAFTTLPSTLERLPKDVNSDTFTRTSTAEIRPAPHREPIYSDRPTLPLSIYNILATAYTETGELITMTTDPCGPTNEAWFKNIPEDAKSIILSFNSAANSWAFANSIVLEDSFPTAGPQCINSKDNASPTGSETAEVTGFVTTVGGVVQNSGTGSAIATESSTVSSTVSPVASASGSGTVTGGSQLSNGTVATRSLTSTSSPGSAPHAPGAMAGSLAGIVGALGVMAML